MQMKRILCGIMALILCLSLAACAAGGETAAEPAPTPTEAGVPASASKPAGRADRAVRDAADKEETVYVQADAAGSIRDVTVETVLNYGGENGTVEDVSFLTDIKNTEGDEEFTLGRDGVLLWEDHGERIRYEGKSGEELPVTVSITYWLDGVQTEPAELAGKSGRVRIRFDYVNHTAETVTVTHADLSDEEDEAPPPPETEEVKTSIPFLAVSLVMLSEDAFQNVTVENGRLVTMGDNSVAVGYAFPGLSEALELTSVELTEKMDIPSFVELEADVTDFSLDFTATILTNGLLEGLETEELDDVEKLTDGMGKLAEASDKLTDGARELADGAEELADGAREFFDYIDRYVSGVSQVSDGVNGLRDGLSAVSAQTGNLRGGAAAAGEQLTQLRGSLDSMDIPEMASTAAALEAVVAAIDTLQAELTALQAYPAAVDSAVGAADRLLAAVDLDVAPALTDLDLSDEQRQAVLDAVAAGLSGARESIGAARDYLEELPDMGTDMAGIFDTDTVAQTASRLRAMAEQALRELDELPASPNEALDQLDGIIAGVIALCDGIDQLSVGSSVLADGVSALTESGGALRTAACSLADGADALADGADTLSDGMREFDEEGIAELADLADGDLADLITRIRALREADIGFDNFGGIAEGRTGSVRFIIETDSIE